jgi:Secretion system C-terminal sorting domain
MRPIYTIKSALFTSAIALSFGAQAQMVGTDVFLRGAYVEVGIGHLGYYGSDAAAPSGYHPHGSTKVGFVADPGMTGWSTGSSHYMGDYFLPGSPFEGWDLQVTSDAVRCQGYNTGSSGSAFVTSGGGPYTGANLSYSTSGSTVIGTWQGTIDSMTVTQVTTLDTNALYFTVAVTFTNLAVAPKDDIYYFRSLDPDNDETWLGGGFSTNNIINSQNPGVSGVAEVTATGLSSMAPTLSLASPDTASRAVIYNSWPISISTDLATVYNETYTGSGSQFTAGVPDNGDIAIGLIMHVPHLATVDSAADSVLRVTSTAVRHPANSATIHYFYAFSPAAVDSAIAHYNAPSTHTLGIQNVNATADINVFPNPATNLVNVTGLLATDKLTVYDLMGREVLQPQSGRFSVSSLPAGHYIIAVSDANGNVRSRTKLQKQ